MRCPDCNKFVSMEMGDPAVESIEVEDATYGDDGKGTIKVVCSVRIVRACSECGTELKEAMLEMESEFELPAKNEPEEAKAEAAEPAAADGLVEDEEEIEHDFEVEETSVDQLEEGGARYKKSYYGAEVFFTVNCNCGCGFSHDGSFSDKVAASAMEEMV